MDETTVSVSTLRKMPSMGTILGVSWIKDMDGKLRECLRYMWRDTDGFSRIAFFDTATGDYVSEDF